MNVNAARNLTAEEEHPTQEKNRLKENCFEWVEALISSLIIVVILFTLFFRIVNVSGPSMLPTLKSGDRVILSGWVYHPRHNDVVVITHTAKLTEPIIKRVIALENEVVDINFHTGAISVNGKQLPESVYLKNGITKQRSDYTFPLTVPKGHVFVLGDNRSVSNDSRFSDIGMIDERYILGKAECIVFPFDRVGIIK